MEREGVMSEVQLPLVEEEGTQLPINAAPTHGVPAIAEGGTRGPSLMTPLGLVEGAVLTYLDEHGATRLRDLTRTLGWSASMVRMGVGALIREGLVEGRYQDLNVIVSPR